MNRPDRQGAQRTAYEKNRQIVLRTQEICGICGKPVDKKIPPPHPLSPTVDHIIPVAKGGDPSALENLQLAHRWCNRWKSDKLIVSVNKERMKNEGSEINNDDLPLHFEWTGYKAC